MFTEIATFREKIFFYVDDILIYASLISLDGYKIGVFSVNQSK